jgi:hypothetical protein
MKGRNIIYFTIYLYHYIAPHYANPPTNFLCPKSKSFFGFLHIIMISFFDILRVYTKLSIVCSLEYFFHSYLCIMVIVMREQWGMHGEIMSH